MIATAAFTTSDAATIINTLTGLAGQNITIDRVIRYDQQVVEVTPGRYDIAHTPAISTTSGTLVSAVRSGSAVIATVQVGEQWVGGLYNPPTRIVIGGISPVGSGQEHRITKN